MFRFANPQYLWLLLAIIILLDPNGIFLYFLAAAAIHELGHWSVIRLCRGTVTRFEISAAGGAMQYHLPRLSVRSEVLIALGGPFFGLALWLAAGLLHHELLAGASLCILQPQHALLMVGVSALLTVIAGSIPSYIASKRDPVIALRSE